MREDNRRKKQVPQWFGYLAGLCEIFVWLPETVLNSVDNYLKLHTIIIKHYYLAPDLAPFPENALMGKGGGGNLTNEFQFMPVYELTAIFFINTAGVIAIGHCWRKTKSLVII